MNSPGRRAERQRPADAASEASHAPAPNLYWDRAFEIDAAKILPGGFYVTPADMLLVTVLGSCVAACIRDPGLGIGGMNHFMLPEERGGIISSSARYGAYAMEILVNHLLKLGARRNRLEAKVFGGGRVMSALAAADVGERNADFVVSYLAAENIPILAQDLLDSYPRKVYFFPRSGRTLVRKLHRLHNETLSDREREYRQRLARDPVSGEAELF